MRLHFLEFKRVLTVLLLNAVLCFADKFVLDGLLEAGEVLLLVLYAALKLPLEVVELSDLVGYACFALTFAGSLCDYQSAFECLEGVRKVDLYQFLRLLNVDLDQLFPNQPHHLSALLLVVQSTRAVECVLQDLNRLVSLLSLVVAFSQSQKGNQLVLLVLSEKGGTLQEEARSITFW